MKTYGRKTSHRQLQSILLNLIALHATSGQNLRKFLALSGLRGCPPAFSFVLTPSFLRLSAWADKCFIVPLRIFPLLLQLLQLLLSGAQGFALLLRLFLTFLVLRGFPLFFLASCLTLFFLGITLRCGLCLPFLNRGRFCIYFPTYFVRRSGWLRASAYIWRGFF